MTRQAFEGVNVADFTWAIVGPMTAEYFSNHGASVVHVESSKRVDVMRTYMPYKDGIPGVDRAGGFANYNTQKYGMTLDLKKSSGVEVAKRLVLWADALIENFAPGVMEGFGLGYDDLVKIKPDIVMLRLSGMGQTGPHRKYPGYGSMTVSQAGFTELCGWQDRLPSYVWGAYPDQLVPRVAAPVLAAALDYRRRTGKGQCLDISQLEASIHFLSPVVLDYTANGHVQRRTGNRSNRFAPHGVYRCKGVDRWCAIVVSTDEEWEGFCRVVGTPSWTMDPAYSTFLGRVKNSDRLDVLVESWTSNHDAEDIMGRLQEQGVAAGVVQNAKDLLEDPQLKHRGHPQFLDHPVIGRLSHDSMSFQLSETPRKVERPAPCLGEHNEFVCTKLLGMSDQEFVEMVEAGSFA